MTKITMNSPPRELLTIISRYFKTTDEWDGFKRASAITHGVYDDDMRCIRRMVPISILRQFLNKRKFITIKDMCPVCRKQNLDDVRQHNCTRGGYVCRECDRGYWSADDLSWCDDTRCNEDELCREYCLFDNRNPYHPRLYCHKCD